MESEVRTGPPLIWHALAAIMVLAVLLYVLPEGPVSEVIQAARIVMSVGVLTAIAPNLYEALLSRVRRGRNFFWIVVGAWTFSHLYFASWRFVVEVLNLSSDVLTSRTNNIVFAIVVLSGMLLLIAPKVDEREFQPTRAAAVIGLKFGAGIALVLVLLRLIASGEPV